MNPPDDAAAHHRHVTPRGDELLTGDQLDLLLEQLTAISFNAAWSKRLVSHAVAAAVGGAGLPSTGGWRVRQGDGVVGDIRWLQLALGDALDAILAVIWSEPEDGCCLCLRAWSLHILHARRLVGEWAQVRELTPG